LLCEAKWRRWCLQLARAFDPPFFNQLFSLQRRTNTMWAAFSYAAFSYAALLRMFLWCLTPSGFPGYMLPEARMYTDWSQVSYYYHLWRRKIIVSS
jgi:hypothetical protein